MDQICYLPVMEDTVMEDTVPRNPCGRVSAWRIPSFCAEVATVQDRPRLSVATVASPTVSDCPGPAFHHHHQDYDHFYPFDDYFHEFSSLFSNGKILELVIP